jgi:bacteriocin biosynthesis cyclodehydratase domain-containing protein
MYYRLRPTADVVPLDGDRLLLRTDTVSIRLEGGFAKMLRQQILPALDGSLDLAELAQRLEVSAETLRENFEGLVEAGVFDSSPEPFAPTPPDPRKNLFRALGVTDDVYEKRIREARIAVFGLERPGALVAEALLAAGFLNLTLVDHTRAQPADFLPDETFADVSREKLVSSRLMRRYPSCLVRVSGCLTLSREITLGLAEGSDLLVSCWDQGFSSGNHWVNRAAHALRMPALFSEFRGAQALAGPFVVPGMTACFMCARMRAVAAMEDYDEAMAHEQFLDQLKSPGHSRREVLGPAMAAVASMLAGEAVRYFVLNQQPALMGAMVEFDPFELSLRRHVLLEHPNCPVCSEKKNVRATLLTCAN